MTSTKAFLQSLRRSAWRTSGARYNGARRLRRRDIFGNFSISVFAVTGVAVTILQKVYELHSGTALDNYLTAASIAIGLFVVIISLTESAALNSVRAESLYRNAEDLNAFQRRLEQLIAELDDGRRIGGEEVTALREEYERTKHQCPNNHETIDANYFDAEQRLAPEFMRNGKPRVSCGMALWIRFVALLYPIWYFGLLWLAIAALLLRTPWPN